MQTLPGDACNATTLAATDDGSSAAVPLPFSLNFFGNTFNSAFVNNNGNITFDAPLPEFTPFGLTTEVGTPIIAPFFADVDTRGVGSGLVHYGATADNKIFCVNWIKVGYFPSKTDKLNSFQLLLIDRSSNPGGAPGDFDIVMNYDAVKWDAGPLSLTISAHAGFSNGTGLPNSFFELAGSGVQGSFLDTKPTGLTHGNLNSPSQPGRYVFRVRGGTAPTGGSISGHIFHDAVDSANGVGGAFVQVCNTANVCRTSTTAADGSYQVGALPNAAVHGARAAARWFDAAAGHARARHDRGREQPDRPRRRAHGTGADTGRDDDHQAGHDGGGRTDGVLDRSARAADDLVARVGRRRTPSRRRRRSRPVR